MATWLHTSATCRDDLLRFGEHRLRCGPTKGRDEPLELRRSGDLQDTAVSERIWQV